MKSSTPHSPIQISLRMALTVPFILLTVLVVALTGFLAFDNGLQSVNPLVGQLQQEIASQMQQTLDTQFVAPHLINRINRDLWQMGEVDLNDTAQLQRHFLAQLQQFPIVHQIGFRPTNGPPTLVERTPSHLAPGEPEQEPTQPGETVWAIAQHQPVWSPVSSPDHYRWMIYAVDPLYDEATQTPVGMLSVGLDLAQVSQVLRQIMADQPGTAFILERNGRLLAWSDPGPTPDSPSSLANPGGHRSMPLEESDSPSLRSVGEYLNQHGRGLAAIHEVQQFELHLTPEARPSGPPPGQYFAQIAPLQDDYGLDWLMVTLLPESMLLPQIHHHMLETIRLCLLALAGTIALGTLTANYLARPILHLNRAALAIAHQGSEPRLPETLVVKELADLAQSLNRMAHQLRESLNRVNLALQASEEKFAKIFHASPDPIRITTFDEGRFIDVNPSFLQFTGYCREEVIGITSKDLDIWINLKDQARFRQGLLYGPVRGLELNYRTKGGDIRTWLFSAEVIELDGTPCILGVSRDITDRKRMEWQLQESATKLRQAQRVAHVGSWEIDLMTGQSVWSEELFRLTGRSLHHPEPGYEDILNTIIHPDDRSTVVATIQQAIAHQSPFELEHRIQRADGTIRHVVSRGELRLNDGGNGMQLFGTMLDITERKRIETLQHQHLIEVMEWQNRYEAAVQASGQVLYEWNSCRDRLTWGTRAEDLLGCSLTDLPADLDSYLALVHPEDYNRVYHLALTAEITQDRRLSEYRLYRPDGTYIWVEDAHQFCQIGVNDPPILIGFLTDITARKQAASALENNREQLNSILNSLDSVVWSVSCVDFRLLYLSPAIQDIYGCHPLEFMETPSLWSQMIHPEDRAHVQQGTQRLYETGAKDQEYRIIRRDGAVRWVRTRARLIRDRLGHSVRIDGITSDITARKQAEADLRASLQEKNVLLSEIHHRVKNNLQVISSLLDIQALRTTDGEARQVLEDSRSRVYSMALVHEHLYRSQHFAQVNFAGYAYDLACYLRSTYQPIEADIELDIQLDIDIDASVSISLDQAIPCGLLINELITNSIKYGFVQRAQGTLYIALKPGANQLLCLSVGNDGDTLPPGFRLDQPFPSMGLQLVVTLVEQLEGAIAFDRTPNTLFHITFPCRCRD